jgi:hypothetical protein
MSVTRVLLLAVLFAAVSGGIARAAPSGNKPVNVTLNIPADVRPNPCSAGDFIVLSGRLHILIFVREDGAGGYHVSQHVQLHGDGSSLVTNVRYQGNELESHDFYAGAPFPVTDTHTYSLGLHGAGPTDDFVMHVTVHTTVNAQGVPTAEVSNVRAECAG